ncbi:MAG: DUF2203 domain-containing protein [Conexivisphaerales archaeon]
MKDGYFTPEEVNSLLPKITDKLKLLAETRSRLEREEKELREAEVSSLIDYTRRKRKLNRTMADMYALIEEVEEYGCIIKDIDIFLVDFPARMFDRDVWLCWKLGEPKVMFWHSKDEGFLSRRPLTYQPEP